MSVLTSKIENGCLDLVLENAKHEVSSASIGGFTQKIRTDVDEITVDLSDDFQNVSGIDNDFPRFIDDQSAAVVVVDAGLDGNIGV